MTTRSELRAKRQQEEEQTELAPTEQVEPAPAPAKTGHHLFFRFWGIVFVTLLSLALLLNGTLLNKDFVKHEITTSSLETVMLDQVNSSLTQYGIPTTALQKSDADKLVEQAVDQVYSGQKISLDLTPVVNNVNSSVNSQLAQFGLSTSMLPAGSSATVAGNLNAAVNNQLNTPQVTGLITGIKIAKAVVNITLLVSAIMLVVLVIKAILQHHGLASFSWISLLGMVVLLAVIAAIKAIATQVGAQFSDISPFISQLTDDFAQRGMTYAFLLAGVAVILFALRIGKQIWQPHR